MNAIDSAGKCAFCGSFHGVRCPEVKAVEYHSDGSLKRVEFMTPRDYNPISAVTSVACGPSATWAIGSGADHTVAYNIGAST